MSAKFLESASSKLAERWVATLLTPAFIFWCGGAVAALKRFTWSTISTWFTQQTEEPFRTALLILALCLLTASAFVVQRFDLSTLRFLEGYWYFKLNPLRYLRPWFIKVEVNRIKNINRRWSELERLSQPTPKQEWERSMLDWKQLHLPLPEDAMPTRLGNLLRAAERYPLERYGLDAIVCWSRLWLLLPDSVKKELQAARADLDAAARVWVWSLLFTVWGFWVWWLAPLGLLAAIWSYYSWAISAAENYGELIRSSFDLYRKLLYDGLRWHLPEDPGEERRVGRELTVYLWRGM